MQLAAKSERRQLRSISWLVPHAPEKRESSKWGVMRVWDIKNMTKVGDADPCEMTWRWHLTNPPFAKVVLVEYGQSMIRNKMASLPCPRNNLFVLLPRAPDNHSLWDKATSNIGGPCSNSHQSPRSSDKIHLLQQCLYFSIGSPQRVVARWRPRRRNPRSKWSTHWPGSLARNWRNQLHINYINSTVDERRVLHHAVQDFCHHHYYQQPTYLAICSGWKFVLSGHSLPSSLTPRNWIACSIFLRLEVYLPFFFPDIPDQLQRTGKTWTSCWAGRLFLILWPEAWWYGDGIGFVLGKGKPKELYSDHVSLFHLISISKSHFVASLDLENFKATSEKPLEFPSPLPNSQENVHDGKQLNTFSCPQTTRSCFLLEQVPTEPSSQPISMCLVGVSMSISARSTCTSTGLNCAAGSCDGAKKVHVPTANARSAKQRKGRRT